MKNNKNSSPEEKETVQKGTGSEEKKDNSLLEDFFVTQLRCIYAAEKKIVQSLPKLENAATTDELKEAFNDHQHETEKHVKRLEKVFNLLGIEAKEDKNEAIEGLVKEAESIIAKTKEGSMTRDAALIMAAQKIEHYEVATYGGLVQLAITMKRYDVSEILDQSLMDEEETDRMLTHIAESFINIEAEEEEKYSWNQKETVSEEA